MGLMTALLLAFEPQDWELVTGTEIASEWATELERELQTA